MQQDKNAILKKNKRKKGKKNELLTQDGPYLNEVILR